VSVDVEALKILAAEKKLPLERLISAIENEVAAAYAALPEHKPHGRAVLNRETGELVIYVPVLGPDGDRIDTVTDNPDGFAKLADKTARKTIKEKIVSIDTKYRRDYDYRQNASTTVIFGERLNEVRSLEVVSADLPITFYNIRGDNDCDGIGNNYLKITISSSSAMLILTPGYYTPVSLKTEIKNGKLLVTGREEVKPGDTNDDYSTIVWHVLEGAAPSQAEIDEAIEQVKADEAQAATNKAASKAAILARLGITADEAALLLG
jgi:hypothetical protein